MVSFGHTKEDLAKFAQEDEVRKADADFAKMSPQEQKHYREGWNEMGQKTKKLIDSWLGINRTTATDCLNREG